MATETSVPTTHRRLLHWVDEAVALCDPDDVHWCDGSAEEYDELCRLLVDAGTFQRLSDAKRPNSYLALSDPGDVARVEDRTFICSASRATSCPACTPPARRWARARRAARGRAARRSTSSTSPRRARSGPTARATAATRCSARSASRCGSPRSWPATRAGWPSTC